MATRPGDLRSSRAEPPARAVPVVDVASRRLIIPADQAVRAVLPTSVQVTAQGDAVPHTIETTRLLRNLGYRVPAPILKYYDWNTDTPFKSQRLTAALLTMNRRAYVLSEMGTGKTRGALHAFNFLHREFIVRAGLVVAPLSSLDLTWAREVLLYFPHLSVGVLHGSRAKRRQVLSELHDLYVINHDGVETILDDIVKTERIDVVILDELSAYKNASTNRWKCMNKVVANKPYVWGMTGSPAARQPTDAWAQCRLLTPTSVPKSIRRFRDMTMTQVSQFKWIPKRDCTDTVYASMQPGVRFTRDECIDIPPRVDVTRQVDLSADQKTCYSALIKHAKVSLGSGDTVTAVNAGALFNKLLQVASGWVYTADGTVVDLSPTARLNDLRAALDEAETKTLVFTAHHHSANGVYAAVKSWGASCELVTGATPVGERRRIFSAFQNTPDPQVIVAHPGCMSHSLTLTAASMIVWYTPIASLETYQQACARISRPGQKNKQVYVHLCGSPVEKLLYRRLHDQASLQNALLELFKLTE